MSGVVFREWLPVACAGSFKPKGETLTPYELLVLAVYADRWRRGERESFVTAQEIEAKVGVKSRSAWDARKRLIEVGALREVRKGGGKGKVNSYAIVESVCGFLANGAGYADHQSSQEARGIQPRNHARGARNGEQTSHDTPHETRGNALQTSQKSTSNLAFAAANSERDHARAREAELAPSALASTVGEREQEQTPHDARGMRGTPREDAGTPPRSEQRPTKPAKVVVIHIPSAHEGTISAEEWAADQAKPRDEQVYMKPGRR